MTGTPLLQIDPLGCRVTARTATAVTVEWDPVPNAVGYRFSRQGWVNAAGGQKYSVTWNPSASSARFAAGSSWYRVEAIVRGDWGDA